MKKILLLALVKNVIFLAVLGVGMLEARASGGEGEPVIHEQKWSFDGPFGVYDRESLQRGLQVYRQVCSACHSMNRVSYRNLTTLGYTEDQVKSLAAQDTITDGPNDEGEMFERPARPSDRFKAPYANDQAARYANAGALPPDLSLITKARNGGADYVYSVLTGYKDAPSGVHMNPGMHYNEGFKGHQIAMPAPLTDGVVAYAGEAPQTVKQYSHDVSAFLQWAGDIHMEERKRTGVKVMIFLAVLAGIMYFVKKRLWSKIKAH